MKTSCIRHPENERLIMARTWQVAFCENDICASLLLNFFEYWHNIKLEQKYKSSRANDIAENHGDSRTQDETLLQFHTLEELSDGILGAFGQSKIREAIAYLTNRGVISQHSNPNPRYSFDRTKYYLFHPEICNAWLSEIWLLRNCKININNQDVTNLIPRDVNSVYRSDTFDSIDIVKNGTSFTENNRSSVKSNRTITEITSKITTENKIAADNNKGKVLSEKTDNEFAAALSYDDYLISDKLTENQIKVTKIAVNQLRQNGFLTSYTADEAEGMLFETLLSPKAYTNSNNEFVKKLNTIKKSIQNGSWTPPISKINEKQKEKDHELNQLENKITDVSLRISHGQHMVDMLASDKKNKEIWVNYLNTAKRDKESLLAERNKKIHNRQ